MNKVAALKNLVEVDIALKGKGFLVYGSALGALREGGIIDHDLDTDFGVMSEDFEWEMITDLINKGFSIMSIFGMRHFGMEIAVGRDGVKTDIMLFYKDQKGVFNCLWDNGGRNGLNDVIIHRYKPELFSNIQILTLHNYAFRHLGEDYVKAVYGEDWRTPTKEWNWRTDHKCLSNE